MMHLGEMDKFIPFKHLRKIHVSGWILIPGHEVDK